MKTFLSLLFFGLLFSRAFAQDFQRYETMEDVDGMVITQNMFALLAQVDVDNEDERTQHFINFVKDLTSIKVLSTHNDSIGSLMQKDIKIYIQNEKLDTLMRLKRGPKRLQFYAIPNDSCNTVKELLMVMIGNHHGKPHYVLLSITGDIDLNEIGHIASALHNVPGARALKHLNSKKKR